MAFSKTPSYTTHQTQFFPVSGSMEMLSYYDALEFTYPTFYNCEPRHIQKWGTDPIHVLQRRPAIDYATGHAGKTYYRNVYKAKGYATTPSYGNVVAYEVVDNKVVRNGTTEIITLGSSIAEYVDIDMMTVGNVDYVLFASKTDGKLYVWNDNASTLTTHTISGIQSTVVTLDNYAFVLAVNSTSAQRIYNSVVGNPTTSWATSTDFIDAEMFSDPVQAIAKHHNHLVVFGIQSTEFFYDNANQYGSPLSRNASYAQRIGIKVLNNNVKPYITVGDDIYFVGTEEENVGIYKLSDFKITKVSNAYIDALLNGLVSQTTPTINNITLVNNFSHLSVVLFMTVNGATKNYVFNTEENIWVEWGFYTEDSTKLVEFMYTYDPKLIAGRVSEDSGSTYSLAFFTIHDDISSWLTPEGNIQSHWRLSPFFGDDTYRHHLKWVDVVGDMNSNTCSLTYSKSANGTGNITTDWIPTAYEFSNGIRPIYRFRNLGKSFINYITLNIKGSSQFKIRGLNIGYNEGTS